MANSYVEYSTGGSNINELQQAVFSYSLIDVLNANDIKALAIKSDGSKQQFTISSRDATAKTVTLSQVPSTISSISKVRIYRQTTSDALVDFVDGARLTESDLDTAYKQGLFVAQEVQEDAAAVGTTSTNNLTLQGTTSVTNLTASGTVTANGTTNVNNLTATGTVVIPSGTVATHFYREGTWTVGVENGTISSTSSLVTFTKIGRLVHFTGHANNFSDTTTASQLKLTGLPYAPAIGMVAGTAMWRNVDADSRYGNCFVSTSSKIEFYGDSQNDGYLPLYYSYLDGTSSEVFFSGTYITS